MLLELNIHNFAIISDLSVSFSDGMTALTGETGAGKSIIIDAVGLLLGARGSSDYLRKGATKCTLEGLFSLPHQEEFFQILNEIGITLEDESIVLQREIYQTGKNICRLNGHLLTISNLKRLGLFLVDIQGQHDHQELLQVERHLHLLDNFAPEKIQPLKAEYQAAFVTYQQLAKKVSQLKKNEKAFVQRLDMLHFQAEEIKNAALKVGEEEALVKERNQLSNYQKIVTALSESYQHLTGEWNVLDEVGESMHQLETISSLHTSYEEINETLSSAFYSLQEAISRLNDELEDLEWDEERLNFVENRLETLRQLKRKYGESVPSILAYYQEITEEIAEASFLEDPQELERNLQKENEHLLVLGEKLQASRKKAAGKLAEELKRELKDLYLEHTQFEVRFTPLFDNFTEEGLYSAEFFIQTNVGEDLKPLVKVASGGELSRLLLGLKTIFAKNLGVTSIVFDEVDSGVSGRVGKAIADKIHKIGETSQVLCITHLPQVAAAADQQYLIEKVVTHNRTETKIQPLKGNERIEVLAKMLAGSTVTPLSYEHAKELLAQAKA